MTELAERTAAPQREDLPREGRSPVRRALALHGLGPLIWPVVLLTALLYLPWLIIEGFVVRGDALVFTMPEWSFTRHELLAGRIPTWDPARLAGVPHLANAQAAIFYPPNWLLLPFPDQLGIQLGLLAHIALGGVLLALLGRALGLRDSAAALAGVCYVAGAGLASRIYVEQVQIVDALAWAPLMLLSAYRLATEQRPRWAAAFAAATALSALAGSTFVTAYMLVAAAVLFVGALPGTRWRRAVWPLLGVAVIGLLVWKPLLWLLLLFTAVRLATRGHLRWATALALATVVSILTSTTAILVYALAAGVALFLGVRSRRGSVLMLVAGAAALLVASPLLWPLIELSGQTTRAGGLPFSQAALGSITAHQLLVLVWPFYYGAVPLGDYPRVPTFWHETQAAGGLVLTALAFYALASRWRDRRVQLLGVIAAVSLLLALGDQTPVFRILYDLAPPLASFRIPARFVLVLALVLPVLAGFGFEEVLDGSSRSRSLFGTVLACAVTASLVAATVHPALSPSFGAEWPRWLWRTTWWGELNVGLGALGLLLLGAAWGLRSRLGFANRLVVPVAYVAVLLDLMLVALPSVYAPPWHTNLISRDRVATVKNDFGPAVVRELPTVRGRVAPIGYYHRYANLGHVLGFQSITADDPLLLARTADLLWVSQGQNPDQIKGLDFIDLNTDGGAAFDVLGAGALLQPGGPYGSGKHGRIVTRHARPLPLLSIATDPQTVTSQQDSLRAVLAPGFDPHRSVVLEDMPGLIGPTGPPGRPGVELLSRDPGLIRARVDAPYGGYLVFSESYYPGWQAQSGGQSVPLVPADHAIMAVGLSPGTHDVTLRFTTPWLLPSLLLALLGVLAVVLLALWETRVEPAFRRR